MTTLGCWNIIFLHGFPLQHQKQWGPAKRAVVTRLPFFVPRHLDESSLEGLRSRLDYDLEETETDPSAYDDDACQAFDGIAEEIQKARARGARCILRAPKKRGGYDVCVCVNMYLYVYVYVIYCIVL